MAVIATEPAAAPGELAPLRKFPHLEWLKALPEGRARELYARWMNNARCFRLVNRRYIGAIRQAPAAPLTPAARRVAQDLTANGIAFADFAEFFDPAFFRTISDRFRRYLEEFQRTASPKPAKGKRVFLDTIHKAHTFVPDDPVSAYLGEPMFAAIAAHYMGMIPRFVGSSFWHTRAADGSERLHSQLWHRDYNDRMLVKVFLYLTDVGRTQGCFEYIAGSHGKGALGGTFDRIGPAGFRAYPESSAVERRVATIPVVDLGAVPAGGRSGESAPWHGTPAVMRCLAPKATLIFADTYGLHRGGFVEAGHRDVVMTTYSTHFNVHKPHFAVTRAFADTLTPFMRISFGVA